MKLLIKVDTSIDEFVNFTFNRNINIFNIKDNNNYVVCYIYDKDLDIIIKYYDVKVLKSYSYKYYLCLIKNNIISYLMVIVGITMFYFISNIILEVNIVSNNKEIVNQLSKSLDNYGIKRLSYKKDFIDLIDIKNKLLEEYKDKIEWIEINRVGMSYSVNFEERKMISQVGDASYCDVVASTSGLVKKIVSSSGVVLTKLNSNVKEGDILISGNINLSNDNNIKVCAKGYVMGEKWYTITIELPKSYKNKEYSKKYRYNLLFENNNNDYKIFKSRFKDYDSDKLEIISLFNKKLYLLKEYEYKMNTYYYDDESLENRVDDLIREKLEISLSKNEKIISKNVLKKEENDSRILLELFVTIERLISKQVTY